MAVERTFVMFKPGVLQRRILSKVLGRIEDKGFKIIAMKMMHLPLELVERHYAEHKGKEFYPPLVEYMTSGPVVAMVLERKDAIAVMRALLGSTDPDSAPPGTVRGDFGVITRKNIAHASDGPESASREIELFFEKSELHPWEDDNGEWY